MGDYDSVAALTAAAEADEGVPVRWERPEHPVVGDHHPDPGIEISPGVRAARTTVCEQVGRGAHHRVGVGVLASYPETADPVGGDHPDALVVLEGVRPWLGQRHQPILGDQSSAAELAAVGQEGHESGPVAG